MEKILIGSKQWKIFWAIALSISLIGWYLCFKLYGVINQKFSLADLNKGLRRVKTQREVALPCHVLARPVCPVRLKFE